MAPWNRRFLLETIIFRFHVKLVECTWFKFGAQALVTWRCAILVMLSGSWMPKYNLRGPGTLNNHHLMVGSSGWFPSFIWEMVVSPNHPFQTACLGYRAGFFSCGVKNCFTKVLIFFSYVSSHQKLWDSSRGRNIQGGQISIYLVKLARDLTRPISPKWWWKVREMGPLISGKSRVVKNYNLRFPMAPFHIPMG